MVRASSRCCSSVRSADAWQVQDPRLLEDAVLVSAAVGEGVERRLDALQRRTQTLRLSLANDALVTINQRHQEALIWSRDALRRFAADVRAEEPPEILAADLRGAILPIGEITGEAIPEEILDSMVSRFCVGK